MRLTRMYQMHITSASSKPADQTPPACSVASVNGAGCRNIRVGDEHQQLGADNAGENGDDAKVPKLVGIKALFAAEFDDEQQAKNQAQRSHQAVGRKTETAKMK